MYQLFSPFSTCSVWPAGQQDQNMKLQAEVGVVLEDNGPCVASAVKGSQLRQEANNIFNVSICSIWIKSRGEQYLLNRDNI